MATRTWTEVTWLAERTQVELLEALAGELGALSVSNEEAGGSDAENPACDTWNETTPGAAPPWTQVRVRALFAADVDTVDLERTIARFLGSPLASTSSVHHISDRDWTREWMRHARALRFGARLWVCPTSAPLPDVREDAVLLRLDPGLGFGTGSHESTALCLEWLESHSLAESGIIDYGCGSGILGIASLLLGAQHVRATDVDPRALDATRDNVRRNHVASRLWTGFPDQMSSERAHIILANITADTLCELAQTFQHHHHPRGDLVLSGILESQVEGVERAFSRWYDTTVWGRRGDWLLLHGRRHTEPV